MSRSTFDRDLAEAIGFRVTVRRLDLDISQRDLAHQIGCTQATIGNVEQGTNVPGGWVILGLCRALAMTPNQLFGWDDEAESAIAGAEGRTH